MEDHPEEKGRNFLEDGYPTDAEVAEERILFDLADRLWAENESRYESQSEQLLMGGELAYSFGSELFVFTLENKGCSLRASTDGGINLYLKNWIPMHGSRSDKLKILKFFISISEARLSLS